MSTNLISRDAIITELKLLKADFIDRYGISRLGVFGSIARDEANSFSDIDIVVDMQPNILKRINLKIELESRFERKVDVIRYWHGMNGYLKARIDREAIYV
jgi:predicted nucleotidyltransferase